jgi:hypothetical protein
MVMALKKILPALGPMANPYQLGAYSEEHIKIIENLSPSLSICWYYKARTRAKCQ